MATNRMMKGEPLTQELEDLLERSQSMRINPATIAELPPKDEIPEEFLIEKTEDIERKLVVQVAIYKQVSFYMCTRYSIRFNADMGLKLIRYDNI